MPLFDENGQRIRGKDNQEAAETALAKMKVAGESDSAGTTGRERWLVANVCSEYLQYCERGVANKTISKGYRDSAVAWLNDLCGYCGAVPVAELKKGHIKTWLESHPTWRSPATHRSVVAIVLAAFNYAEEQYEVPNPLKGLKKPASQPRLHSFSKEDEEAIYGTTEERFREFLFAAIHTGLRPFSELAKATADDVEENGRGMMWRVFASKTKKTRKLPVRPEVAELTRKLTRTAP
jgi:integrase